MCKKNMDIYLVRYLACLINIIILVLASIAAAFALSAHHNYNSFKALILLGEARMIPFYAFLVFLFAVLIIIYGFIAFLANGFGMLICFSILMLVQSLICCVFGFYIYLNSRDKERSHFYFNVVDLKNNTVEIDTKMEALQSMEKGLHCCGLVPNFYGNVGFASHPITCCKDHDGEICEEEDRWDNNCVLQFERHGTKTLRWIFIFSFSLSGYLLTNAGVAYLHAMAVKQFFYY